FQKYKAEAPFDAVPDMEEEGIITDRPHVAETPHLVPKGYVQIETGFQLQKSKTDLTKTTDITYNTTLVRYGISKRFELRMEMEYLGTKTQLNSTNETTQDVQGLSGLYLGSKIYITQQKGVLPEATLMYGVFLPYPGNEAFRPDYTGSEIKFLLVNKIAKWYEFEYNLGVQWDGVAKNAAFAYAINNEFDLWKSKLFFFAELYGYFIENGDDRDRFNGTFANDHRVNGGFWYRVTPNNQFDISAGLGLNKISPEYYVGAGFCNRFSVKKKRIA
ncbi:MAG: transporter, partial [Cytophagales bacterium]|nr:transporter [Cytophagales bacterium]